MTGESKNWIEKVGGRGRMGLTVTIVVASLLVGAIAGVLAYREIWLAPSGVASGAGKAEGDPSGPGNAYAAQFWTESMFPEFSPKQRRYVTRCTPAKVDVEVNARRGVKVQVDGFPPASGQFSAEARPVPGQDFEIEVTGAGGPANGTYNVRCLPVGFPEWSYKQFREPPRGTFVVAFRPEPKELSDPWIIAFDQDGLPRWWYTPEFNALLAQILDDGTFQWARGFGDGFGQDSRGGIELMELDGTPIARHETVDAPIDGHEFVKLKNGNYLLMSYRPRAGVDMSSWGIEGPAGVLTGEIQEITPNGDLVWRWNSWDHIGLDEIPGMWRRIQTGNPHTDADGLDRYDYFHLNSIEPWRDEIVISTRHTNAVYGISRKTGEVKWKLGGRPNSKSLEILGPDPYRTDPLSGNHDARITDGNLLTIHDNGTRKDRPPRLVRYRIDPEAGTATFVSEVDDSWAAPKSMCCGSARKFGDGWLVGWGDSRFVSGFDSRDRLAFRLELPSSSYRAMPVPQGVTPPELDAALESVESDLPVGSPIRPLVRPGG
jgi:hypothetical protein